jgi:hypothetical protein
LLKRSAKLVDFDRRRSVGRPLQHIVHHWALMLNNWVGTLEVNWHGGPRSCGRPGALSSSSMKPMLWAMVNTWPSSPSAAVTHEQRAATALLCRQCQWAGPIACWLIGAVARCP